MGGEMLDPDSRVLAEMFAEMRERFFERWYRAPDPAILEAALAAYAEPEPLPALPYFEYTQYAPRHPDGLALVMPAMHRELVRREEQADLWGFLYIDDLADIVRRHGVALPISGDDRPYVRGVMR